MKSKAPWAACAPPEDSRLRTLHQPAPLKLPCPLPADHACPAANCLRGGFLEADVETKMLALSMLLEWDDPRAH